MLDLPGGISIGSKLTTSESTCILPKKHHINGGVSSSPQCVYATVPIGHCSFSQETHVAIFLAKETWSSRLRHVACVHLLPLKEPFIICEVGGRVLSNKVPRWPQRRHGRSNRGKTRSSPEGALKSVHGSLAGYLTWHVHGTLAEYFDLVCVLGCSGSRLCTMRL